MTPTFINHCTTVYKALEDRAESKPLPNGASALVFSGSVMQVYQSLGISQAYYGPIFETLEDVGSIQKLQRGARGVDTVIVLLGLPEVWPEGLGWKGARENPLTEDSRYGKVLHDVQEIQSGQIGGINVLTALVELDDRLTKLEAMVLKLGVLDGKTTQ